GLDVHCGCFGSSAASGRYAWWIARDLALLAACAFSWRDDGTDRNANRPVRVRPVRSIDPRT
ncbi:MAG TPA: hypothetical protein PLU30_27885, partial [Verrucomicrobiae bacterium]|nr:hypothetical protein [Verrucomicrobiae bacterium]